MLSASPHHHLSFTSEALILKGLSGRVDFYFGALDAALLTAVPLSASSAVLNLKQRPGMRRKRKEAGVHHETSSKPTCGIWKMILTPPCWIFIVGLTGKSG